jgi:hypothetical protein
MLGLLRNRPMHAGRRRFSELGGQLALGDPLGLDQPSGGRACWSWYPGRKSNMSFEEERMAHSASVASSLSSLPPKLHTPSVVTRGGSGITVGRAGRARPGGCSQPA